MGNSQEKETTRSNSTPTVAPGASTTASTSSMSKSGRNCCDCDIDLSAMPTHRAANMAAAMESQLFPALTNKSIDAEQLEDRLARKISAAARKIWDYHHMRHVVWKDKQFLNQLDGILVFCSSDVDVARVAAELWIRTVDVRKKVWERRMRAQKTGGSVVEATPATNTNANANANANANPSPTTISGDSNDVNHTGNGESPSQPEAVALPAAVGGTGATALASTLTDQNQNLNQPQNQKQNQNLNQHQNQNSPRQVQVLPFRVPFLLFSGGMGSGPHSGAKLLGWTEPEALVLSRLCHAIVQKTRPELARHLPLLVEPKASNSGENTTFSRALLEKLATRTQAQVVRARVRYTLQ